MQHLVFPLLLGAAALTILTPSALAQGVGLDSAQVALRRLTDRLDLLEAGTCPAALVTLPRVEPGSPAVDSLIVALGRLATRVDRLTGERCRTAATPPAATGASTARAAGAFMNIGFDALTDVGWSSERNVRSLQLGDHDPAVRGFTLPNTEVTMDGAVDPYFKGFANIVFKLDENGETGVELEEVFALTTSLPANLQLKGGQFFAEFGRQNAQHPHAWAFVDQPLVLNRLFGPDGLRGQGLRASWLAPTSFYTEAAVTLMNSAGGTTFSFRSDESSEIHGGTPVEREVTGLGDMLLVPRVSTSLDLTSTQTVVVGASAAFGPNNAGTQSHTRIVGGDLYWKWKSARAQQGFPFVSWQSEVLVRRYETAERTASDDPGVTLPAEALQDRGAYSQLLWGVKPRWILGLRGDWADGDAAAFDVPLRASRTRISPNVTWFPTEFSKLRLQYNYDHREGLGSDSSLWMQFEFMLGAHASHKF